jgi:trimeric autotransporter adhesin
MKTMNAGMLTTLMLPLAVGWCVFASGQAQRMTIANLPSTAQSNISAALARENPAYYARSVGADLVADNAAQKLRAHFSASGVQVRSAGSVWKLALSGYGYGNNLIPLQKAVPSANQNRVEYRRGPVTEWYVNGPLGLEQGFTIQQPPPGADGQRLTVALTLAGNLRAAVEKGNAGLQLDNRYGKPELQYTGLVAHDANDRELPAETSLRDGQLLLQVDDRGARYPVVIDPVIQLAKLTTSGGEAFDENGYSVATSGSTVVVGAPGTSNGSNEGMVYVFVKPAKGWANMTQTAALTASNGAPSTELGYSVSISGNTIVAGAPDSNQGAGAAYIFVEPTGGWTNMTQTAELTASDGEDHDGFGSAVAISGSTVVISSPYASIGTNAEQGAAYVFTKSGSTWTQSAKLSSSDGVSYNYFGSALATTGNTVVAGAPGAMVGTNPDQGAAYVFVKSGASWSQAAKLTASNGENGNNLGHSVAIGGSTIVAGTYIFPLPKRQGSAYVYVKPAGGWASATQTAELTANDPANGDQLGFSVSISGSTILVGAPETTVGTKTSQGAAYSFVEPAGGWVTTSKYNAKIEASDGAKGDQFGYSVAISGSTEAIGAISAAINGNAGQGATYLFQQ